MNETMEIDVMDLARGLWKRAWIIILCAVLAASISLVYTMNFITPTYQASVTMYVNNNSEATTGMNSSDLAVALQLVNTYVNIIQSDKVLEKVVNETGLNISAAQIRRMLTAEVVNDTEMFRVSIISPNAQMSTDIVNAIASIAPNEISQIVEGSNAKVVDYAKVPSSRHAPSYVSNTILGGLIGAFLVIAVIVVIMLADNRVRSENDLRKMCNVPVLGAIPDFAESAKQVEKRARNNERRQAR